MNVLDDLTKEMMKNGNSFYEIDNMNAADFLNYLDRISKDKSSEQNASMLSADEFFNRF
ncbi:MAG: hypothetical protein J6573_07500 [Lactobacillus sp.]|nr:hypothetical protein [Lactobacillus sp.]